MTKKTCFFSLQSGSIFDRQVKDTNNKCFSENFALIFVLRLFKDIKRNHPYPLTYIINIILTNRMTPVRFGFGLPYPFPCGNYDFIGFFSHNASFLYQKRRFSAFLTRYVKQKCYFCVRTISMCAEIIIFHNKRQ